MRRTADHHRHRGSGTPLAVWHRNRSGSSCPRADRPALMVSAEPTDAAELMPQFATGHAQW
jgi:hypothetical protein